ncbi:coiled-coil domain-containing protein 50 [Pelodytes ibericus]
MNILSGGRGKASSFQDKSVSSMVRDFAVLEDHTLAHSLQEQEIEHHLATNIHRNRLVKHDLQVAKQLQEEEDLKAQARKKNRHNELELLDGEIAQEIQEKLVIEAERRRRQEAKDEDIARLLQEKEEKRRKNYYPSSPTRGEPHDVDHEGHRKGRHKEHRSEHDRHHRHERLERQRRERSDPKSECISSNADIQSHGRSGESWLPGKSEDDYGNHRHENHHNRSSNKIEKPERPPPPRTSRHDDVGNDRTNGECMDEQKSRRGRSQSNDFPSKHNSGNGRHRDSSNTRAPKSGIEGDFDSERHRRRTPSPKHERHPRDAGHRPKGTRDAPPSKNVTGPKTREEYDAEIARKLQEKELKVNIVDVRAAQMAQDEEIARYLMEKEEKAYKKSRGREKISDRKRSEEREPHEHVRPRSRESQDQLRSRSDKPYRPLPPSPDEDDYDRNYTNRNQHSSPRSDSKSQSSHKGSYYRP